MVIDTGVVQESRSEHLGLDPGKPYDRVYTIQPLADARWQHLIDQHGESSVFHTPAWLGALKRTYGNEPVAYTTSPPGSALRDGLVFCSVNSRLTGKRMVSLPFSDHCEPLLDRDEEIGAFYAALGETLRRGQDYFEFRSRREFGESPALYRQNHRFCFHALDLTPSLDSLFKECHKDCIQRRIRRAEKAGLTYQAGRSAEFLEAFYRLLIYTRRRHQVFPQPKTWFQNLIACFGERLAIRVAFFGGRPVASILTLRHKDTLVYKYGGSDARFHALGSVPFLFWQTIQEARHDGIRILDLGRSDLDQPGLILFKDRFGAKKSTLSYSRFSDSPFPAPNSVPPETWSTKLMRSSARHLPHFMMPVVGSFVYRHVS
jgi:CelD/BcsL family acetyltransferase involved in cellulose biosynthesis